MKPSLPCRVKDLLSERFVPGACFSPCPLFEFQKRFGNRTFLSSIINRTGTEHVKRGITRVVCSFPRTKSARWCFFRNLTSIMVLSGIRFGRREPQDCGELRRALWPEADGATQESAD